MRTVIIEPPTIDLNPFLTKKSIDIHFNHHHMQYYNNLSKLVSEPIEDLIGILRRYNDQKIINNASQIINHNLFWCSLGTIGEDIQIKRLLSTINFYEKFREVANSFFGSGWVWLTYSVSQGFEIFSTPNALYPLDKQPLLVLDAWEHSFYVDYLWNRKEYNERFLQTINFQFIRSQLQNVGFNIDTYLESHSG
jgi:Fe-Mn family superoxide dismutase